MLLFASWDCSYCLFLQGTKCKCCWRISYSSGCIKDSQNPKCCRACLWNHFDDHHHCPQSRSALNRHTHGDVPCHQRNLGKAFVVNPFPHAEGKRENTFLFTLTDSLH